MTVSSFLSGGPLKGDAIGDYEGKVELYAFNIGCSLPTDVRNGTVTGARMWESVTFVMEQNSDSVFFAQHLCDNKEMDSLVLEHFRPDPKSGDIKHYFTHEIKKAKVVSYRAFKMNTCDPASKSFRDMCEVQCRFEKIKIKDTEGNEYEDSWNNA